MNNENRYAPPKAVVDGITPERTNVPPLWNPDAAANWSLLFTPIFGSWLHMLNWRALGETERAKSAKTWLLLLAPLIVGGDLAVALMPGGGITEGVALLRFVLLLAWYFGSARGQARLVKAQYGNDYVRRRWARPLLGATGLWATAGIAMGALIAINSNPTQP